MSVVCSVYHYWVFMLFIEFSIIIFGNIDLYAFNKVCLLKVNIDIDINFDIDKFTSIIERSYESVHMTSIIERSYESAEKTNIDLFLSDVNDLLLSDVNK
jgi:hypothetical protein